MTVRLMAPPPVRGFVVAALLCVVGAALVIGSRVAASTVLLVVGLLLLAAGVVLMVAGLLAWRRGAVDVTLDDDGYHVNGADGERSGDWADVVKVTQAQNGSRLTLHHSAERRTVLVSPAGGNDPKLARLGREIAKQLDRHRGYTGE